MQLNINFESNEEVILENAIKNHNYKSLVLFSVEAQSFLIKNKFNEQQKNELLMASLEYDILDDDVFIGLCRESQEYNSLLIAFRSDAVRRGYYDAGRIEEIYLKAHKDKKNEFEIKKEKNEKVKNENGNSMFACDIKNSILYNDFLRLFENQDKAVDNNKSLFKKLLSAEFAYETKSWMDRFYFWFRVTLNVASNSMIFAGILSVAIVVIASAIAVSTVTDLAIVLIGVGVYYLTKYFFRNEKEIKESYEKNAKLAKFLKKAKEIYSRVINKEKDEGKGLYLKDLKKVDTFELRFDDKYNEKHIFKLLSNYFLIASLGLGIIFTISSVAMMPIVSSLIVTNFVSFNFLLATSLSFGTLSFLSVIGWKLSRNKYKALKNEFTKEKNKITKTKLELSQNFKNKIRESKIKPGPKQEIKEINHNKKENDEI